MPDVSILYNNSMIATMDATGAKTLKTGGKYVAKNIAVAYVKPTGKAHQAAIDVGTSTSTSYIDAGLELTVAKSGTYKVSWEGFRTTTSGTAGSQMYKNGTAYGSPNTTFGNLSNYGQINILEHVSLQAGDNLKIYARSRGSGYAMFVGGLLIEEE